MDPAVAWTNWAVGVLDGIGAPVDGTNLTSLWNWSNKESGSEVMRWNNPLNTTMPGWGGVDENSVGVKAYPSVVDGIQATVTTLLNGRYPTIVGYLRGSVPHHIWQNAAAELTTWGTGANWLAWSLQPPLEGEEMSPDQDAKLTALFNALVGPNAGVNYLGWSRDVSAALAAIQAAGGSLSAAQAKQLSEARDSILRIENALKSA